MKTIKKVGIIILILINVIVVYWTYNNILEPAYASYMENCFPNETNKITEKYYTAGKTYVEDGEIIIDIITEDNSLIEEVYKHENCHKSQIRRGAFLTCESGLNYISELECYTSQKLPFFIYNLFY